MLSTLKRLRSGDDTDVIPFKKSRHGIPFGFFQRNDSSLIEKGITYSKLGVVHRIIHSIHHLAETYSRYYDPFVAYLDTRSLT